MGVVVIGWSMPYVVRVVAGHAFQADQLEAALLGGDAFAAAGFLILAVRYTQWWLGIAMLMQSIALALHGAALSDWGVQFRRYLFLNNFLGYGVILLIGGMCIVRLQRKLTARHRLRQANSGSLGSESSGGSDFVHL